MKALRSTLITVAKILLCGAVKSPLSGTSWVVWGYEWTPTAAGKYTVQVRATDGDGKLQAAKKTDPYPNGATGYHSVTYRVN